MAMDDLEEVLKSIIEKIQEYRTLYEKNEQAVRDHLISPILEDLGWDPKEPEQVLPNIRTEDIEDRAPDYTLLKNGKEMLLIEAKKLGADIERRESIRKLAEYCSEKGITYGVLTNGNSWLLMKAFEKGKRFSERIIWRVDIAGEGEIDSARKLRAISRENVEQIESLVEKFKIVEATWDALLKEPKEMIDALVPVIKNRIASGHPELSFEDTEILDLVRDRMAKLISAAPPPPEEPSTEEPEGETLEFQKIPRKMRLGTDSFDVQLALDIAVNTANWLIDKRKLNSTRLPIQAGPRAPKRYLISEKPIHRNKERFEAPHKLKNGWFMETKYGTGNHIKNARWLLKICGLPPETLVLEQ